VQPDLHFTSWPRHGVAMLRMEGRIHASIRF